MISVITVTKGRLELLEKCINAVWSLCSNKSNIEHIILYDDFDQETEDFLSQFDYITKVPIHINDYPNRNMHKDYWNVGAKMANGDIIMGICNDTIITTKNYDAILDEQLNYYTNKLKHKVFQILIDDDAGTNLKEYGGDHEYCSWIVLTQDAVKCIDGLCPKEIICLGGDIFTYNIFKTADCIINLKHLIKTKHITHYNGTYHVDDVMNTRPNNFRINYLNHDIITDYISKLLIEKQRQQSIKLLEI